jgi:hypothetical protein
LDYSALRMSKESRLKNGKSFDQKNAGEGGQRDGI